MRTISKADFDALNSSNWAELERAIKSAQVSLSIRVCRTVVKAVRVRDWLQKNRPQYCYWIQQCDPASDGFRIMAERKP